MISASVPESEAVLNLLLQKGADVNEKSKRIHPISKKKKPIRSFLCEMNTSLTSRS